MKKQSPQFVVYIVGVALLGFFYEPVKTALGGQWIFLASAIFYLVALRLIGSWAAKVIAQKRRSDGA